jgi:hypothetical protein
MAGTTKILAAAKQPTSIARDGNAIYSIDLCDGRIEKVALPN